MHTDLAKTLAHWRVSLRRFPAPFVFICPDSRIQAERVHSFFTPSARELREREEQLLVGMAREWREESRMGQKGSSPRFAEETHPTTDLFAGGGSFDESEREDHRSSQRVGGGDEYDLTIGADTDTRGLSQHQEPHRLLKDQEFASFKYLGRECVRIPDRVVSWNHEERPGSATMNVTNSAVYLRTRYAPQAAGVLHRWEISNLGLSVFDVRHFSLWYDNTAQLSRVGRREHSAFGGAAAHHDMPGGTRRNAYGNWL